MALSASRAVLSKVRLTTLIGKHGNKNFYKGRGAKKFGKPDKWGNFQFNAKQANRHSLQVPPLLNEFPLRAYVAHDTPKISKVYVEEQLNLARQKALQNNPRFIVLPPKVPLEAMQRYIKSNWRPKSAATARAAKATPNFYDSLIEGLDPSCLRTGRYRRRRKDAAVVAAGKAARAKSLRQAAAASQQ